ncbi:MAG: bifunctional metallophosphatase/5'-nucleotidase [Bacteroidota bacterium]
MPIYKCQHHIDCNCHEELIINKESEDFSRRNFLKLASTIGFGFSMAPSVMGNIKQQQGKDLAINASQSVQSGKAKKISILHTADIHGQLMTHDEFFLEQGQVVYKKRGGLANLKTLVNTYKKQNPYNTLLVDGGDCIMGSAVAAFTNGSAMVPLINNMGYDITLPGNWEVVYGKEWMMNDLGSYNAQKICANMYHDTNDEYKGDLLFQPYTIKYIDGIKIGFIGYNDPLTAIRQAPAFSRGIRFTRPEINIAKYIKILKEKEQCTLVILLTHIGLAQQVYLSNQDYVKGVDYILGADTHERVRKPLQGKYCKVTEPGAFGSFISKLDIVIENGKIVDDNYELIEVDPDKYKEDKEMKGLIDKAREPYKKELNTVIGQTTTPLVRYYVLETTMDNLLTSAVKWKMNPDIALSNGFRFCPPIVPGKDGKADITVEQLYSMLPGVAKARRGEVTGKQLLDWLEGELENVFASSPEKRQGGWLVRFTGMKINITIGKPKGKRVNSVLIGDAPLDLSKTYTVAACERDGDLETNLCRITDVKNPQSMEYTLHDIVKEYLQVHSPIAPKIEGKVTVTDAPQDLLSQVADTDYVFR